MLGPRPAAGGNRRRLLGHSAGIAERAAQQHLKLSVDTPELVICPTSQRVVDGGIDAQQDLTPLAHVYNDPVFTTGDGG